MDATTDMGCAASPVHARVSAGEYKGVEIKFVDVWRSNIHEEFAIIRTILEKYPYVAMVRRTLRPPCLAARACP